VPIATKSELGGRSVLRPDGRSVHQSDRILLLAQAVAAVDRAIIRSGLVRPVSVRAPLLRACWTKADQAPSMPSSRGAKRGVND